MLKAVLIIAAILAAGVAGLLGYASTKPDHARLERTASIKAPPEKIHPLINDLRRHAEWSPWEKVDPGMQRRHSGAPSGKGAVYEWEGNKDIGSGRMEILETTPQRVLIKLDFLKPMEAHNMAEFTFVPKGDATEVTWAMYGPSPLHFKVMSLFFDAEKMVGPQFERGLADLKTIVER